MAQIDINPATGAPVVRDDDKIPVSDFVAQVQSHIDDTTKSEKTGSSSVDEKPISSGPGSPAPQHQHLIDSARKFNENLKRPAILSIIHPTNVEPSMADKIQMVLKDNGMDSQQQERALHRIRLILSGQE